MIELKDILTASGGQLLQKGETGFSRITVDSRTTQPGALFVALSGKRRDGHQHIPEAIRNGATGLLVSRKHAKYPSHITIIQVSDGYRALEKIASQISQIWGKEFIAVTGSSGKTTTKEMIAAILGKKYRVFKNEGNLNTEIGVPIALVQLSPKHQLGVLELAMQKRGEIRQLAHMIRPKVGVITNIGPAHIAFLKTLGNTAYAKGELLQELPPDGVAVLPRDDKHYPTLKKLAKGKRVITFGLRHGAHVRAKKIRWSGASMVIDVELRGKGIFRVQLKTPGLHMVQDALASIAVGDLYGVPKKKIQKAIGNFRTIGSRSLLQRRGKLLIIRDEYNANPDSMRHALETLARIGKEEHRPTIAVLGDMLELGHSSRTFHADVGRQIRKLGVSHLVALGHDAVQYVRHARLDGAAYLSKNHRDGARRLCEILLRYRNTPPVVLFKGSRGMQLERIAKLARI